MVPLKNEEGKSIEAAYAPSFAQSRGCNPCCVSGICRSLGNLVSDYNACMLVVFGKGGDGFDKRDVGRSVRYFRYFENA
jgi:hypothetical protein